MSYSMPSWFFSSSQNGFCWNTMCTNDYCLILTYSVFFKTGLFWKETCKEKNTVAHRYCNKSGIYCAVCPTNAQLSWCFLNQSRWLAAYSIVEKRIELEII
uniref:Uncharacterized protein n=1 Tax=Micrurus spixii TaxID=129469 RepID=A0A2D4LLW5_9SAUR